MNAEKLKIYLAADSTVQRYDEQEKHQGGWGEFLQDYFTDEVKVENHAIGGRSSKTFIEEGRLDKIAKKIKAGDFLLIQMGHNDAAKNKPERYTEPFTTYKQYLKKYIDCAKSYQAEPVLITPAARLHLENNRFINDFPEYCQAMKEIAVEEDVALIDLMEKSLNLFDRVGYQKAFTYFMASVNDHDYTHFTKNGAKQMARLVADGIKELEIKISHLMK
ncbi:rhamnogalacturonan acetylesterase [Neobacillus muris]|uniref:rhamnogalacturonan acetylesterase n=1 Tax=Neobacillus muris TaxID=2941334 RepID=UPI00203A7D42|nr:rhamnogalacturonan acetylesterase [Neobacillus muris]